MSNGMSYIELKYIASKTKINVNIVENIKSMKKQYNLLLKILKLKYSFKDLELKMAKDSVVHYEKYNYILLRA